MRSAVRMRCWQVATLTPIYRKRPLSTVLTLRL